MGPISPDRLRDVLDPVDWQEFERAIVQAREVLGGTRRLDGQLDGRGWRGGGDAALVPRLHARGRRQRPLDGDDRHARVLPHHEAHPQHGARGGRRRRASRRGGARGLRAGLRGQRRAHRERRAAGGHRDAARSPDGGDGAADEGDGRERRVAEPHRRRAAERAGRRRLGLPRNLPAAGRRLHLLASRVCPGVRECDPHRDHPAVDRRVLAEEPGPRPGHGAGDPQPRGPGHRSRQRPAARPTRARTAHPAVSTACARS